MNINISDLILFYQAGVVAATVVIAYDYIFKKSKREGLVKEFNRPTPFEQSNSTKNILLLIALVISCLMSWVFIGWKITDRTVE